MFYLNNKYQQKKFDTKAEEGLFFGYSTTSKAYRVYNIRTLVAKVSVHVVFYESNHCYPTQVLDKDIVHLESQKSIPYCKETPKRRMKKVKKYHMKIFLEIRGFYITTPDQSLGNPNDGV